MTKGGVRRAAGSAQRELGDQRGVEGLRAAGRQGALVVQGLVVDLAMAEPAGQAAAGEDVVVECAAAVVQHREAPLRGQHVPFVGEQDDPPPGLPRSPHQPGVLIGHPVADEGIGSCQLFEISSRACRDMAAEVTPDQVVRVGQSVRILLAGGIEQESRRFDRGATDNKDPRLNLFLPAAHAVDDGDAGDAAVLINQDKKPLFTADERVAIIRDVFREYPNVETESFDGLLVDYARRRRASAIIRGIRAVSDYEYEFQMALMNRHLAPGLETVFMMPDEKYTFVSSRLIKEVFMLGGEVAGLVPPVVEQQLRSKQKSKRKA